jgi:hypothetical protein
MGENVMSLSRKMWGSLVLLFLGAVAVLAACRDERSALPKSEMVQATSGKADFAARAPVTSETDLSGRALTASPALEVQLARGGPSVRSSAVVAAPNLVIRNGNVSIQVDSLESSIDAVRKMAAALGGYVGNVAMYTGENQVHSATLEVKIPAARFDDAMAGVRPLGKVESSSATAQDVGEEFVDISARIANSKRLEARLIALLSARTGKLEDVLAVERELARVREEIERSEGRVRYLSSRIAMSTIAVTVHEKPPLVASQPGTNVLGHAFANMLRNFVGFVAAGIEALGVVVPTLVLAALVWVAWTRTRRRHAAAKLTA